MATVEKSIGTDSRDYSTITSWGAALGGAAGGAGDDAIGSCYNDSDFSENVSVSSTDCDTVTLTSPAGERHDGSINTGVRILTTAQTTFGCSDMTTEFLEINAQGNAMTLCVSLNSLGTINTGKNLLIHNVSTAYGGGASTTGLQISRSSYRCDIYNCIVFDFTATGPGTLTGIGCNSSSECAIYNNTVDNFDCTNASGTVRGIPFRDDSDITYKNNLVTRITNSGGGTANCYVDGASAVHATNGCDDSSSPDGSTYQNLTIDYVDADNGDLHLTADSDGPEMGTDLGSSRGVNIDSDSFDRDTTGVTWGLGALEYGFTYSVGTDSRDYSTMTAFEAAMGSYPNKVMTGSCYNDSVFNEAVTVNDNTPESIQFIPAAGEQHDGTASTGVRNIISVAGNAIITLSTSSCDTIISWIEISTSVAKTHPGYRTVGVSTDHGPGGEWRQVDHCIIHGMHNSYNGGTGTPTAISGNDNNRFYIFVRNICYDLSTNGTSVAGVTGIIFGATFSGTYCINNTLFKGSVNYASATGNCYGMTCNDNANATMRNNIVLDFDTNAGSGAKADFATSSYSNATVDHNMSSDTSSSGTGSQDNIVAADQFVSITAGLEDLHIISTSDAVDAGADLGTTQGSNIDINGRDVDAEGDTWDVGAHEFVSEGDTGAMFLVM